MSSPTVADGTALDLAGMIARTAARRMAGAMASVAAGLDLEAEALFYASRDRAVSPPARRAAVERSRAFTEAAMRIRAAVKGELHEYT